MRLRRRLVLLVVLLGAFGILISGVVGVVLLRSFSLRRVDSQLEGFASRSAAREARESSTEVDCARVSFRPRGILFELYNPDGTSLCAPSSADDPGGGPDLTADQLVGTSVEPFTVDGRTGDHQYRVTVRPGPEGVIAVLAIDLADATSTWHEEALVTAGVGLAVIVVLGGVGIALVRRELAPLEHITDTADHIAAGDMSRRVDIDDPDGEVGRLAAAFNTMIDEIESAFAAQQLSEAKVRQFVADASHELRTPLSSIRGFAELFRNGGLDDRADLAIALRRVEEESARMGKLVDDLLLLARLDERPIIEHGDVDLSALVRDAVLDLRATAPDRTVSGEHVAEDVMCRGDAAALRQVLANLTTNSRVHTHGGSPIEITLYAVGSDAVVEVIDHGAGIPAESRSAVFDRFVRLDPSRTRSSGGSGLGLAIVGNIVAAHHGTVSVRETSGGGATFVVTLPVALAAT